MEIAAGILMAESLRYSAWAAHSLCACDGAGALTALSGCADPSGSLLTVLRQNPKAVPGGT